jgi:hypothetical protein
MGSDRARVLLLRGHLRRTSAARIYINGAGHSHAFCWNHIFYAGHCSLTV